MQLAVRRFSLRLGRAPFIRGAAVIAGGSAVAQAIPVLLTPVLTRLYTPSDMGLLALYLAYIGFATSATTLGFSLAIPAAGDDDEAADLVVISALVVVPVALAAGGLLWLLTARSWLGYGELPAIAALAMVLSLALTGWYFTLRYWLVRTGRFGAISNATIMQSGGRVGTQVIMGVARVGWPGLIAGEVIGRGFGLRRMWRATWRDVSGRALPLDPARLRTTAMAYRKFPLYSTPSALLNGVALVLPVPLISAFFGVQEAGQFSIASRVLLLPMALVGASVGDVFHNRLAILARERPDEGRALFLQVSGGLLLIGIIPMAIVAMYGEALWATVLGEEWAIAGLLAAAIAPWALMQLAVSPVSRVVTIYQRQELKLIYDVLGLVSIVGVLTTGHLRQWSLVETCVVLGWSQAMVYAVYFILLRRIVRHGRGATNAA